MPKKTKSNDEKPEDGDAADAIAKRLRGLYQLADVAPPDGAALTFPTLYYGLPADEMAIQIADHLRGKNLLFVRDEVIGTVDTASGLFRPMDSDRFRTWLPGTAGMIPFQKFDKDSGKPVKTEIKVESARAVLASDQLRDRLPRLRRINLIRMPVLREALDERGSEKRKGYRKMELLGYGYDAETETYTVKMDCPFDEGADPNEAVKWFRQLLKYFDMDDRSRAVQIASMLTVFGAGLFRGRSPLFTWNSPHGGSGKSRLAQLTAETVFPSIGRAGYHWRNPEETRKEIDAVQRALSPVLWFDDVTLPPGMELRSTDLNRWLTAGVWQCRVIQTGELYAGKIIAATMLTGTHLELDEQLFRRALWVDIFPRMKARDRVLPKDAIRLDDSFFLDEKMRSKVLSYLWALCRWWDDNDRPPALSRPLESFENWAVVIPAIVSSAGFADCLAPFEAPDAGERSAREMKALVRALVLSHARGKDVFEVTMKDVIREARLNGLFVESLGALDSIFGELNQKKGHEWRDVPDVEANADVAEAGGAPEESDFMRAPTDDEKLIQAAEWRDRSIDSKFGKEFQRAAVAGQWFKVDEDIWQFGKRKDYRGSRFEVAKVREAAGD